MSVDPYTLFFIFIFGRRTSVSFKRICLFLLGKSTRLNGYVYFSWPASDAAMDYYRRKKEFSEWKHAKKFYIFFVLGPFKIGI